MEVSPSFRIFGRSLFCFFLSFFLCGVNIANKNHPKNPEKKSRHDLDISPHTDPRIGVVTFRLEPFCWQRSGLWWHMPRLEGVSRDCFYFFSTNGCMTDIYFDHITGVIFPYNWCLDLFLVGFSDDCIDRIVPGSPFCPAVFEKWMVWWWNPSISLMQNLETTTSNWNRQPFMNASRCIYIYFGSPTTLFKCCFAIRKLWIK